MPIHYVSADLDVGNVSFSWAARHLQVQMLRNFATPTWVFRKDDGTRSSPGCIIAAASLPNTPITDQDYVHCWVRDAAVCAVEAIDNVLPGNSVLDDYVAFSLRCQQAANAAGCPDRACFTIDGKPRDGWSDQTDGVAHRIDSVIDVYNRLAPSTRAMARSLLNTDLEHLLAVYRAPTQNLWEETSGFSFFARSMQQRALRRVLIERGKFEISEKLAGRAFEAAEELAGSVATHRRATADNRPYYASIDQPSNGDRGAELDADVVMAAGYGAASCRDEVLLSTAALLRDWAQSEFSINRQDQQLGLGPVIGRYRGDAYDGTTNDPSRGHPWPVTTCSFAELYYLVAKELIEDGANALHTPASAPFFTQVGVKGAADPEAAGKLIAAADAMLAAVLYHSDQLELSEQIDRDTGYQVSVRSLTWSYAAFLRALRARDRAIGTSFGTH